MNDAGLNAKKERLASLQERLVAVSQEEDRLSRDITAAVTEGADPSILRAERTRLREEKADLQTAIPNLASQIESRRREVLGEEAQEELVTLKRRCGGITGEYESEIRRLGQLLDELEKSFERVVVARPKQVRLKVVVDALAERTGLTPPELKMLPAAPDPGLATIVGRIQRLLVMGAPPLSQKAQHGTPIERVRDVVPALTSWGIETRALEHLGQMGPTQDELERVTAKERERKERAEAERRALAPVIHLQHGAAGWSRF